jgi:hypothetical protein
MWVEQLEHLGSYAGTIPNFDLLRHRWSIEEDMDTRAYLYRMAVNLGITTSSPRMNKMAEEFFSGIIPEGTWA